MSDARITVLRALLLRQHGLHLADSEIRPMLLALDAIGRPAAASTWQSGYDSAIAACASLGWATQAPAPAAGQTITRAEVRMCSCAQGACETADYGRTLNGAHCRAHANGD